MMNIDVLNHKLSEFESICTTDRCGDITFIVSVSGMPYSKTLRKLFDLCVEQMGDGYRVVKLFSTPAFFIITMQIKDLES